MNLVEQSLQIPAGGVALDADLAVPEPQRGVVLFAHGSGSSRHSPRNRYVAGELQASGLATVLADLLTPREDQLDARTGRLRFDIDLLATRVTALTDWVLDYRPTAGLPAGLFGASTGAAAALVAAAERPSWVAVRARPMRRPPASSSRPGPFRDRSRMPGEPAVLVMWARPLPADHGDMRCGRGRTSMPIARDPHLRLRRWGGQRQPAAGPEA